MKSRIAVALFALLVCGTVSVPLACGETKCLECHHGLPFPGAKLSFNEGIQVVCSRCHVHHHGKDERNAHPIDMVPSLEVPRDMPLDISGRMTCITCHTYHIGHDITKGAYPSLLRRTRGRAFCYSCHKKTLF